MEEKRRLESLDILRGFAMIFAAGGDDLMVAFAVACGFPADGAFAQQFQHVAWHGFHFEDFIYPFFVFIAGVTWPYSLARQREKGATDVEIVRKVLMRGAMLIALGLLCSSGFLKHGHFQWASVLGRIGVCWGIAALVWAFTAMRTRILVFWGILVSYWLLLLFRPAPGTPAGADPLTLENCFVTWINPYVCPVKNQFAFSVYAMIASALAGMFAGAWLKKDRPGLSEERRSLTLAGAGGVAIALGCIWAFGLGKWSFPLNKILWSSSLVLVAGGIGSVVLALAHWLVDEKGFARWGFVFKVVGMNSILFYVLARSVLPFDYVGAYFFGGLDAFMSPATATFVHFAGGLAVLWLLMLACYRHKVFLKV